MKITSLTFGRSQKINLGNYESIDSRIEATAEVVDGDHEKTFDALRDWVEQKAINQRARIVAQYKRD